MSDDFDPYYKWLAIPPEEQPPNHYRLLGLRLFESDVDVIGNAVDARMLQIRSYQSGSQAKASQKILSEISAAKLCLLQHDKREEYDAQLRKDLRVLEADSGDTSATAAPPAAPPVGSADEVTTEQDGEPVVRVRGAPTPAAPPPAAAPPAAPPAKVPPVGIEAQPIADARAASTISTGRQRSPIRRPRRKSNPLIPIIALTAIAIVLLFLAIRLMGTGEPSLKIKNIGTRSVDLGGEFSVRVELESDSEFDGDVEWVLDESPKGAKIDRRKGRITWTPSSAGKFDFRVVARSADNENIEDSARFEVNVVRTVPKPSGRERPRPQPSGRVRIESIGDKEVRQGEELAFFVTLSRDVGDAKVWYRLGPRAPAGAEIDEATGAFHWTPSSDQEPGVVRITVGAGVEGRRGWRDRTEFKVTVLKPVGQPIVDEIADKEIEPGEELKFQVSASDPNDPPSKLKYELDFPPDGASIDEETGKFTWTPSEDTAGRSIRVAVRVTQTDGSRRSTVRKFQVKVKGDPPKNPPGPDSPVPEVDGVRTLSEHTGVVGGVTINPRGSVVASAAADGTIRMWSVKTGKELQKLEPESATLGAIRFSYDSSMLAAGGADDVVRVWDSRSGELRKELKGLAGDARALEFSTDGKWLAAGSSEAEDVLMWNVETGEVQETFKPGEKRDRDVILSLAFRLDGRRLAAGRLSGVVVVWDTSNGRKERDLKVGLPAALAFRPDNRSLAVGSLSRKLYFWQFGSSDVPTSRDLDQAPTALVFSNDGSQLAVVMAAKQVQVWDVDQRKSSFSLKDVPFIVRAIRFNEEGDRVILAGSNKGENDVKLKLWDFKQP